MPSSCVQWLYHSECSCYFIWSAARYFCPRWSFRITLTINVNIKYVSELNVSLTNCCNNLLVPMSNPTRYHTVSLVNEIVVANLGNSALTLWLAVHGRVFDWPSDDGFIFCCLETGCSPVRVTLWMVTIRCQVGEHCEYISLTAWSLCRNQRDPLKRLIVLRK